MKHENQKDAPASTASLDDTAAPTAQSPPMRRELSQDELALVVGGTTYVPPLPLPGKPATPYFGP